jgi:hypothetical protein
LAERALARLLSTEHAPWMRETTANNLRLLRSCSALDAERIDALVHELDAA